MSKPETQKPDEDIEDKRYKFAHWQNANSPQIPSQICGQPSDISNDKNDREQFGTRPRHGHGRLHGPHARHTSRNARELLLSRTACLC